MSIVVVAALLLAAGVLLFAGRTFLAWVLPSAFLLGFWGVNDPTRLPYYFACGFFVIAFAVFGVPALRRIFVSRPLLPVFRRLFPTMSETERIALEAGTVWWDGELFSGNPNWRRVLEFKPRGLSKKEQDFLAGPVEDLCRMLDDWRIRSQGDLPPEAWEFIKRRRFFGMIIPEEYDGLGFSALAHSAVVTKLSSRSIAAAVTVMVPNSLGPAELLLAYGTEEQKRHFLPKLARGEEIPCFALTEPGAGSDAASLSSDGVVCRGPWQGQQVIGIRLNWEKRYITLGPVATLLGLAFRLRDPERLLGGKEDFGITCALISPQLPGIEIGRRHDPLGVPFQNGPNRGRDVFVPVECIIGGVAGAGEGWRMLMQCLAAGRSISLPSLAVGAAQLTTRVASAYANVREQFGMRIGLFEGIEERLVRIAGLTYIANAARTTTASAVDAGEKPAVVSAIVKAYLTEMMRVIVNDGMDIQGGAAVCVGPRNALAGAYSALPIGITVEGANILTRSLIIYGQGALRCHPFVRAQLDAVLAGDGAAFDRALFGHMGFAAQNAVRAFARALGAGVFEPAPAAGNAASAALRALSRYSAAFATLSDAAMGMLGGSLKRREKLSGRFADALAWMYLTTAVVKDFVDRGEPAAERPLLDWASAWGLFEVEQALFGVIDNLPLRPAAWGLRFAVFPFGARRKRPSDALGASVARVLLEDRDMRSNLTAGIYRPNRDEVGLGRLEDALEKAAAALPARRKIRDAIRAGRLTRGPREALAEQAAASDVISKEEQRCLQVADEAAWEAIQVDAFSVQTQRELQD